jgi:hypothetical protein
MIAARRLMTAAFRSVVGPISLGLLVLSVLFLGLPKIMGYFFGALCLWFALATGLQLWRRRDST